MNIVERVEKGLDRTGLISKWDELTEQTDYVRGLILTEAFKDCDENSSLTQEEYFKGFFYNGKSLSVMYARQLAKTTKEKAELKKTLSTRQYGTANFLKETEAELTLPSSSVTQISLKGDNAIQKARNWEQIKEATGKEEPTDREVRQFNKDLNEAKKEYEAFKKEKTVKSLPKPEPFTLEEELDFESWCVKVHNFDVFENRPRGTKAIYALKDEKVGVLFSRLNEWKTAYKIMAKLCHPDTGGNSLAMSFLSDFKELMNSLKGIEEIVNYENKIEQLRAEYSTPKVGN